jgi:adenosylhomocysteinase
LWVTDRGLAARGAAKIELARRDMAGLAALETELGDAKPLAGVNILGCVTPTAETGVFVLTLALLGANMRWCSDNRFAVDEHVVAHLSHLGIPIFARANMSPSEYLGCMREARRFDDAAARSLQIVDDGGDVTAFLVENDAERLNAARGISEQTTCGVAALRRLYARGALRVPAINVNDCFIKKEFDNHYGVRESLLHLLTGASGIQVAAKKVAVYGYGPVGRGAAEILRALGARVSIVDRDLLRLVQASFDGFEVSDPDAAIASSDICVTATGCIDVIPGRDIERARDGAILCNIGHGTSEYDVAYLERAAVKRRVTEHLDAYRLASGKTVYSFCAGALANLVAGGGNPPRAMSLTFTLQALAQLELADNAERYAEARLYELPHEIELECARLNFPELASKAYVLTSRQQEYVA